MITLPRAKKTIPDLRVNQLGCTYHDGKWQAATVTERLPNKSFVVATPAQAKYRRTRSHLYKTKEPTFKPTPSVEMKDMPIPPLSEVAQATDAKFLLKLSARGTVTHSEKHSNPPRRLICDQ